MEMKAGENIIGYDANGNSITDSEFIADIKLALQQLQDNSLETYDSETVKRIILKSE
jgi:hypothetical protein